MSTPSPDRNPDAPEQCWSVFDRCFETIELAISFDEFERLPRHGDYKYEYFGDRAVLSPNPYLRDARLATDAELILDDPLGALDRFTVRPLRDTDEDQLSVPFAAAFAYQPPFATLSDDWRRVIASDVIAETFAGRRGPLVLDASCVISNAKGIPFGACLITLAHDRETTIEPMLGQPHLTWLFVAPMRRRRGLATHLLGHTLKVLRSGVWPFLYTTFLVGNHASAMWH